MLQSHEATDRQLPAATDEAASTVQGGKAYLADVERRLAAYFARAEPRQRALTYLRGLLSSIERKNSWQLAEVSGAAPP
jgi:tRNA C32,U32 (ribose-2'-O)-methylase TrmJ